MSKAILVMDMPESCDECHLFEIQGKGLCRAFETDGGMFIDGKYSQIQCDEGEHLVRQDWCPLKELPSSKDAIREEPHSVEDYRIGWNDCLKEILGDEDE